MNWPHETPPGRCIHWPRTCAEVQVTQATASKPCAHCAPELWGISPTKDDRHTVDRVTEEAGEDGGSYVRSPLAAAVIERLEEREKEAKEALAEHRAERDPDGTTLGSLKLYTEARIYRDAILTIADADYERHVLTTPGVAEGFEIVTASFPAPADEEGGGDVA